MEFARRSGLTDMDLDDFEEYLADKPEHEKWELIGGRVVKLMVGARWSHHRLVQNINFALTRRFTDRGSPCRTYTKTFWLKERFLRLAVFPDVMVHCGPVDRDTTSVDDPVVLVEVVSPGSVERDHIEKGGAVPPTAVSSTLRARGAGPSLSSTFSIGTTSGLGSTRSRSRALTPSFRYRLSRSSCLWRRSTVTSSHEHLSNLEVKE